MSVIILRFLYILTQDSITINKFNKKVTLLAEIILGCFWLEEFNLLNSIFFYHTNVSAALFFLGVLVGMGIAIDFLQI